MSALLRSQVPRLVEVQCRPALSILPRKHHLIKSIQSCIRPQRTLPSAVQEDDRIRSSVNEEDEDPEILHDSFLKAYHDAQSEAVKIPGLQEFAAAVWERHRSIPSQNYHDPLEHIFTEFDTDSDGHLTAVEVAKALRSRNVEIDEAQAQAFIESSDTNNNHTVEREDFANLIWHMAAADLRTQGLSSSPWQTQQPPQDTM